MRIKCFSYILLLLKISRVLWTHVRDETFTRKKKGQKRRKIRENKTKQKQQDLTLETEYLNNKILRKQ